jgi:hypothetical protein
MSIRKLVGGVLAGIVVGALCVSPALADGGITVDPATGRFVTGGENFFVGPGTGGNYATVAFECNAAAGPDASQTRVLPADQNGCVLYKGGTAVGYAEGQSVSGAASVAHGTAQVDLRLGGSYKVCWNVSATYVLNEGQELYNSGCGF